MHALHPLFTHILTHTHPQVNARETKKLADKERQLLEKAHRMREEAMREDDNVRACVCVVMCVVAVCV